MKATGIRGLLIGASACVLLAASAASAMPPAEPQQQPAIDSLELANKLRDAGNLPAAAAAYRELARHPGDSVEAHLELAAIYRKMNRPLEAAAVLADARQRQPGNTTVLSRLAQTLVIAGKPEEAVNVFDQLIAMEPDKASHYNGKAVAFDTSGNHVAAEEIYEKALSLEPASISIRNNLAMSMILNDELDEAIALLEPLANQDNAPATVRQNLALAYGIKGDTAKAREFGGAGLSKQQVDENMRFYQQYATMKKEQRAAGLAERSVDEAPATPVTLSSPDEEAPAPAAKPKVVTLPKEEPAAEPEPPQEAIEESAPASGGPLTPEKIFGKDVEYSFPSGSRN